MISIVHPGLMLISWLTWGEVPLNKSTSWLRISPSVCLGQGWKPHHSHPILKGEQVVSAHPHKCLGSSTKNRTNNDIRLKKKRKTARKGTNSKVSLSGQRQPVHATLHTLRSSSQTGSRVWRRTCENRWLGSAKLNFTHRRNLNFTFFPTCLVILVQRIHRYSQIYPRSFGIALAPPKFQQSHHWSCSVTPTPSPKSIRCQPFTINPSSHLQLGFRIGFWHVLTYHVELSETSSKHILRQWRLTLSRHLRLKGGCCFALAALAPRSKPHRDPISHSKQQTQKRIAWTFSMEIPKDMIYLPIRIYIYICIYI